MFDSAPPNLPVEPVPKAPPQPPQMPSVAPAAPPVVQQPMVVGQTKKEPEDIFKGLDAAGETPEKVVMPEFESAPSKLPIKLIAMIVGGLVVLGGIGFAVWYFVLAPKTPAEEMVVPTVTKTPTEQVETPPPMPDAPVTTPPAGSNIPAPQPINQPPAAPTGSNAETQPPTTDQPGTVPSSPTGAAPVEGSDTDQDMLTNAEEALLGTDSANRDTNGNTYPDGTEVLNQYDPAKKGAPLSESTKLKWLEWEGVKFLAPTGWRILTEPLRPEVAIVDTETTAKLTIQKRGDLGNRSLRGWLALPDNDTSMKALKPKAGWEALQTADGLTTYVAVNGTIYILTYELNGAPAYEFRTLFALLANSLQVDNLYDPLKTVK